MPLAWNEIRQRAFAFAKEWGDETSEDAEAKPFWHEFFEVFGVKRRTVASFEEPVKNLAGNWSYIDLFWPSKLLVEHKSGGKSLDKAHSQAMEYIRALKTAKRDKEIPQYVVVSDFQNFALYDLDEDEVFKFKIADLPKHVRLFAFIAGYVQQKIDPDDPLNIQAVELLGKLHDELEEGGYTGHDLERFLVRILFCLFADKTGIFEAPNAFALYIENNTEEDGSDLGIHLDLFFRVLDQERNKRQNNLDEDLAALPHVNGDLFREKLEFADFNQKMRDQLLNCTRFDWSKISPAVFGSLFQSVMEPEERRQVGAHYTSEADIMKVVRSLFLDDLRAEFEKAKGSKKQLKDFHKKLANMKFLDPACGCGNFLVVTYRELRMLELEVLKEIFGKQKVMDINDLSNVDVDSMFGIEVNEFPCRIAEVAMWLVDHQMNQALSAAFGEYYVRLPLKKCATIRQGNALRINWSSVLPPKKCSFVLGNPPFVGKKEQTKEQKADLKHVFGTLKGLGVLDYVCGWYMKAIEYIDDRPIECAFVSTNSITQGEHVGIFWKMLIESKGAKINFAHRTFAWQSEARGKAHVHVVIVGFAKTERSKKFIFDYLHGKGNATVTNVSRISPYLADAPTIYITNRSKPISNVPRMNYGSMANDKKKKDKGLGHLILNAASRKEILAESPAMKPYIKQFMGSTEFINDKKRWCLWLADAPPQVVRGSAAVKKRLEEVRKCREKSGRPQTRKLATTPGIFGEIRQPSSEYLLVPKVSSETRNYLPVGFVKPSVIANGSALIVPNATLYHLGVLSSAMHMSWVRHVGGRMKSDYQMSARLLYNNFPWPQSPTAKQKAAVEAKAQLVLDARAEEDVPGLVEKVVSPSPGLYIPGVVISFAEGEHHHVTRLSEVVGSSQVVTRPSWSAAAD